MIAELGVIFLTLGLGMCALLSVYPLWGAIKNSPKLMSTAQPLAFGLFLFTAASFACLTYLFIVNDFSVAYVAHHSNLDLPLHYRITGVWGGHEGSVLLWLLMFAGWTVAVAFFSKQMPQEILTRALSVMGMIGIGFYLFVLLVSNPFDTLLPFFPVDGRELNPLLQDFGMIVHPPMLYMGYVGFSVSFAFAIAALMTRKLDSSWAKWSRPWTLAAWICLTIGMTLGSWWAYYELGWGGWWFWDPVENASFMPWLVGTALIHSLAASEKRGVFKSWTVLLAIAAFSLSLFGTFIVRSGIIVSVHAFATDPSRGLFILVLLLIVVGGSLLLYGLNANEAKATSRFQLLSRESLLLTNNIFLTTACVIVFLGTLLPMIHKELGLGSISIGEPFFNQMFTYLIIPTVFFMGIGPLARWRQQPVSQLQNKLLVAFAFSITMGLLVPYLMEGGVNALVALGAALTFWIFVTTIQEIQLRAGHNRGFFAGLGKLSLSHWGMVLGHLGIAVMIMGITLTENYTQERHVRMQPGQSYTVYDYEFRFNGVSPIKGPNYEGHQGDLTVLKGGEFVTELAAEKRFYPVAQNVMTEAAIDPGFTRDLYVALGEQLNNGAWALRLYVRPFVRWIWLGGLMMSFGGLLCIADRRYRPKVSKTKEKATEATEVTA